MILLSLYYPTLLEKWISEWYIRMDIIKPEDIDIEKITDLNSIIYDEKPINSHYLEIGDAKIIIVDSRLTPEIQREQFFHELCHVLRHAGKQSIMPKTFRELQEWNAKHFTRYAAIPYHMLQYIDFTFSNVVSLTSEMFKVSTELVVERFFDIKRKTLTQKISNIQ